MKKEKLLLLADCVFNLYKTKNMDLPFHGWHHIQFVRVKGVEIARSIQADDFVVESAALTHDMNYLVEIGSNPERASDVRNKILSSCHYLASEIALIEKVILDAHTGYRLILQNISKEAMALSDADTLFKALPITPIIFANRYILENSISIRDLALKVTVEQNPLMEQGKYFYTEYAKQKYLKWAQTNLILWNNVIDCLADESVVDLLKSAKIEL